MYGNGALKLDLALATGHKGRSSRPAEASSKGAAPDSEAHKAAASGRVAPGAPAAAEATAPEPAGGPVRSVPPRPRAEWANRIYCHTSQAMVHVPDQSVGLAFTSPPYNAGKDYDEDLDLEAYLSLIRDVAREVYRVLVPGGRYVVNIANLGRKPYIPLHAHFYAAHSSVGFLPAGEIIWRKGKGMNGSCAWGSWCSAKSPRLRDLHEYLLVFVKEEFGRPDSGTSTISRDDFMAATLSVWDIPPESARRVGHPAPFPMELAERVIRLFSFQEDVVLDPFCGSGTTCAAAKRLGRDYVGYDIVPDYCEIAQERIEAVEWGEGLREVDEAGPR